MTLTQFESLEIDARLELIVSGAVVRVLVVDYHDGEFMDENGAWHSYTDAELAA